MNNVANTNALEAMGRHLPSATSERPPSRTGPIRESPVVLTVLTEAHGIEDHDDDFSESHSSLDDLEELVYGSGLSMPMDPCFFTEDTALLSVPRRKTPISRDVTEPRSSTEDSCSGLCVPTTTEEQQTPSVSLLSNPPTSSSSSTPSHFNTPRSGTPSSTKRNEKNF